MKNILLFFSFLFLTFSVNADEGMWLINQLHKLDFKQLQENGLKLSSEDIYSINKVSIKDAVVSLNNGHCTGYVVSPKGLIMTCFHCSRPFVQKHATIETDYIKKGFWAKNLKEELRNEKLSASFLIKVEDVTSKVLSKVKGNADDKERMNTIYKTIMEIEKKASSDIFHNAEVKSFYKGNQYILFTYLTYPDVRLVGTPPESIGAWGGETDNWTWPRYRADFAFLRIYTDPSGNPAPYNKKNIPFQPKKHLPISIKGLEKDDFTMIVGYPSVTDRQTTSAGIDLTLDIINPAIIEIRTKKLELLKKAMEANEEVYIKYIAKYKASSNYWKYFIGQVENLEQLSIYDKKVEIENKFEEWVNSSSLRKNKYGSVLDELNKKFQIKKEYDVPMLYHSECFYYGTEITKLAHEYQSLYHHLKIESPAETIDSLSTFLRYFSLQFYKDYDVNIDKKIFTSLMELYINNVSDSIVPDIIKKIKTDYSSVEAYSNELFDKSILANKDKMIEFLYAPTLKSLKKDMGFHLYFSLIQKRREITNTYHDKIEKFANSDRLYMKGLMEMDKSINHSPDANSTMRFSYGKITNYGPSKYFSCFTNIDQMMVKNKENASNSDFKIPKDFKDLYYKRDFGKYANKGMLPTCFITDNDIVGGNSGSPLLNGNGEVAGIVFDLNWAATSTSLYFDPKFQRTISTDSRYILYVVDKYANSKHIMKELTIIE